MSVPKYVVGFLFAEDGGAVVLVRKARPVWQIGKLNGVGGRVENGESLQTAMAREFREETGAATNWAEWRHFATIRTPVSVVHFLAFRARDRVAVCTATDEEIVVQLLPLDVDHHCVANLRWLIPLGWHALVSDPTYSVVSVHSKREHA